VGLRPDVDELLREVVKLFARDALIRAT